MTVISKGTMRRFFVNTFATPLLSSAGVLLLLGLLATPAQAQSGMRSVDAVGTGGGTAVLASPTQSLYTNPANLTVGPRRSTYELQLFDLGAYAGGDLLQFNHYNDHLTSGETLSQSEATSILQDWFGGSMRSVNQYAEFVPVSMTYRPAEKSWAAGGGLRFRAFGNTQMSGGLFDLLLRGTGEDRTVPLDGHFRYYNTMELTGAFSYRLSSVPLSLGVSPKIIFGSAYAGGTLRSQVTVSDTSLTHRYFYTAQAAGPFSTGLFDTFDAFSADPMQQVLDGSFGIAGMGAGLDLGATYTVRPDLYASLSITDLSFIRWFGDAQTVTPQQNLFEFEGVNLSPAGIREFDGSVGDYVKHQVDSLAQDAYRNVDRDRSGFASGLPTTVHLSSTWNQGDVLVNGGISVGINRKPGATPRPLAVHGGGEVSLGPVPLRAGLRLWGTQAVTLAGGAGLDLGAYRFDLGVSATPTTSFLGKGARYAVRVSFATIRF